MNEENQTQAFKIARRTSNIGNAITFSILIGILLSFGTPQVVNPWIIFGVAFLVMIFAPGAVLVIGMKTGKIDFDVTEQSARTPYYLIIECFYVAGILVFSDFVLPSWSLFCVSIVSAILNGLMLVVNLRWKISAHAAGAAGPATGIIILFGWWTAFIMVPIVAMVIWSRHYLKKHTPMQLLAGTLAAVISYMAIFLLLYPVKIV